MKVSIRKRLVNDLWRLQVYRPRERTWALNGGAWRTKSGYWIVTIPEQPADVVLTEKEARAMLLTYWENVTTW